VNAEPRPAAWLEDLAPGASVQILKSLRQKQLVTTWGNWGLSVEPLGNNGFVAVVPEQPEAWAVDEEGRTAIVEKAAAVLEEAGFAVIMIKRRAGEEWGVPWLKVYGKSAVGAGPRTIRQTVEVNDLSWIDLNVS
jgi:hypothetical protein